MNKVFMIGALDCYGVPYTPDNLEQKSYLDLLAEELGELCDIDYVNMHSIAFNKTWELESLLKKDFTKEKYYNLNKRLSQKVITTSNRFDHPVNENFLSYYDNVTNPTMKITTAFSQASEPIFIYSCGGMNLDYYLKCPTCDLKKIIPEFIFHIKDNLNKTMSDIENTLLYIKSINPKTKIYLLGVYPMIENKILRYLLQDFYRIYNAYLKKVCSKLIDVYYVDVFENIKNVAPHDNHPNFKGQQLIKKQVINSIYKNQ